MPIGKQPTTEDELLGVSGVGPQKLAHYGPIFISEITAYQKKNEAAD